MSCFAATQTQGQKRHTVLLSLTLDSVLFHCSHHYCIHAIHQHTSRFQQSATRCIFTSSTLDTQLDIILFHALNNNQIYVVFCITYCKPYIHIGYTQMHLSLYLNYFLVYNYSCIMRAHFITVFCKMKVIFLKFTIAKSAIAICTMHVLHV